MGKAISTESLLYGSDSALINQVFQPKLLSMLNLAGFGMIAWDETSYTPSLPWRYHSTGLPVFDNNLRALSQKITSHSLLAHIRGVPMDGTASINEQNLHPFSFPSATVAMAHNGDLAHFEKIRYALLPYIRKEILPLIRGDTDSEWIYALLMSQFDDIAAAPCAEEICEAVERTLAIIRNLREKASIDTASSINLFISSPNALVAVRYSFDYGCYPLTDKEPDQQACIDYLSLWFTLGSDYAEHDGEWKMIGGKEETESIIVSSEPLSADTSTWVEVPEYHLLLVDRRESGLHSRLISID